MIVDLLFGTALLQMFDRPLISLAARGRCRKLGLHARLATLRLLHPWKWKKRVADVMELATTPAFLPPLAQPFLWVKFRL